MAVKNFATFGLFDNEVLIDSGSIQRMENEALRLILGGKAEALRISVYGFKGETVIEETQILSFRKINDDIYISNLLLKGDNENTPPNEDKKQMIR